MDTAVKYSGIVVSCNDSFRLGACLDSLSFCDNLVVVDLMSEDDSVAIAESYGAEVHVHERVPVVELIRESAFSYAKHPWIVHIDPDEIFPKERLQEISEMIILPDLALIRMPWQFYFKGRPLRGTIWGGENSKPCIFHRDRIVLSQKVHVAPKAINSFREIRLVGLEKGALAHYWVDTYGQMFQKHLRYAEREGVKKYESGERFSSRSCINYTWQAFKDCYITHSGWVDGVTGIFLSIFYAWYVSMCSLSLRNHQKLVLKNYAK